MKHSLPILLSLFLAFPLFAQKAADLLDDFEKDLIKTTPPKEQKKEAPAGSTEDRLQKLEETIAEWSKFGEITKSKAEEPLFLPNDDNEGIYPDISVLNDPFNPYRNADYGSLDVQKWARVGSKNPEKDFYIWATLLALGPNGENQFYTAVALRNAKLYDQAIRAYQAVLDYFPDSVTYTKEGYKWNLADGAAQAITELGGKPRKAMRAPFKFNGGTYQGWMQTSTLGSDKYDPWTIGQRHMLELVMSLTPSKELTGIVSFKVDALRPNDIMMKTNTYMPDRFVGEEWHTGTYINKVNLVFENKFVYGNFYKGVATQSWDDILDIHPKWWWLAESEGRGWGYPAGFIFQEKMIPYNTRLTFEAGPAPNDIGSTHLYYLKATPEIGPVTLMLARRASLQGDSVASNEVAKADAANHALYLNGSAQDTFGIKLRGLGMFFEAQAMLNENNPSMIYTNYNPLNYIQDPYPPVDPVLMDFMTFAGRIRYNEDSTRYLGKRLPLTAELSAIYAGKWVFNGNKMEINGDLYAGPFSLFLLHFSGTYRMNPKAPVYHHPGTVFADNRAARIFDLTLTFDMTPNTLMRETWGDKLLTPYEDAPVAVELGFKMENYPTYTDPLPRIWGWDSDYYPEPNNTFGLYPCTLYNLHGVAVINAVKNLKITLSGSTGVKQAGRGSEIAVQPWTSFLNTSLELRYNKRTSLGVTANFNDWFDFLYDELPSSWSPLWGVTADQNIYVNLRHNILNSAIEGSYEYVVSQDMWNSDQAYQFFVLKYIMNF